MTKRSTGVITSVVYTVESLLQRARELARPRPFGSPEEAKTREAVAEALESAGWSVREEPFSARLTIDVVVPLGLAACAFLLIVTTGALSESPPVAAFAAISFLVLNATLDRIAETILRSSIKPGVEEGTAAHSANLRATHPALCGSKLSLLIVAHLDAKRQSLPFVIRCGAAVLTRCSGAVSALAALGFLLAPYPILLLLQRAGFVLAACGATMLLINSSDGQTDGAVDNAGSLSGLVEIAKRLSTSPHLASGLHVELVATAGEEAGCLGAMALASSVVKNSGLPIVLNLEALGAGPRLLLIAPARKGKRKENRASLAETITASASEERVAVTRWLLAPGFWTDHRPFLRAGCEAVTLCGFGRGISTIHTHLDRVERLDGEALAQQVEFVLAAVARLATV